MITKRTATAGQDIRKGDAVYIGKDDKAYTSTPRNYLIALYVPYQGANMEGAKMLFDASLERAIVHALRMLSQEPDDTHLFITEFTPDSKGIATYNDQTDVDIELASLSAHWELEHRNWIDDRCTTACYPDVVKVGDNAMTFEAVVKALDRVFGREGWYEDASVEFLNVLKLKGALDE